MNVQITAFVSLAFLLGASAHKSIYSGFGFGTYYYDVKQVEACHTSFAAPNTGALECEPEKLLSLDEVGSNYVVAMNHSQLVADMAKYCGKRVVVTVNGKQSDLPLFIGDGCVRCAGGPATSDVWNGDGAPGLDFSYSVLQELSGAAACRDGHVPISWEILDDTIYSFSNDASSTWASAATATDQSAASASHAMSTSHSQANSPHPTVINQPLQNKAEVSTPIRTCTGATGSCFSRPCPTGAWQCNGNILEQCLINVWTPRITCGVGMTCEGGDLLTVRKEHIYR